MKKVFAAIIILAILGINITLAAPVESGTVYVDENVKVQIHPNEELLGIVYYLAFGNDTFVIDRGDYINEVEAHFGKYRNSTAVIVLKDYLSRFDSIYQRDAYLATIEATLLLCSEPPELKMSEEEEDASGDYLDYLNWFKNKFLPALREFANETNFTEFYRTHQDYYMEDLRVYKGALSLLPPDEFMEEYAGVSNVTYVFLHPYLVAIHGHNWMNTENNRTVWGAAGFLPLVRRTPQRTVWSYKTARDTMMGLPLNRDLINSTGLDELLYLTFIYHELGHDITLPALYLSNVEEYEYLQDVIAEDMEYLAKYDLHFWNPIGMIYEGFADAWADYATSHVNHNYTLLAMQMQKAWGEFWIERLYNEIQSCALEVKSGELKNISLCVPRALESLEEFASPENVTEVYNLEVPVTPLRAIDRGWMGNRVVVIYGTANLSPTERENIKSFADEVAETLREFYRKGGGIDDVVVKPDVNVTPADLSSYLVLIGTPSTNRIVDIFDDYFPVRLEKAGGEWRVVRGNNVTSFLLLDEESPLRAVYGNTSVAAGGLKEVEEAALLMASVNPYNTDHYVVWISGTDENLIQLFKNPTYYLSSYEIWTPGAIEVGFYNKPLAERLSESFNATLLLSPQTTTTTTTTVRTVTTTAPETTTTTSTTTTSTAASTTTTSTTSPSKSQTTSPAKTLRTTVTDENMCGPAAIAVLALFPLLIRRRR
ncbi:hypothetical protein A3L09_05360 [Thermococcus profundus]|uniref:CGP-CTERM sorting domain-containing protein n=1 Tax=Thermococcus profundus TaxID=49899 RepID=A0A2Z2MJW8_THEPR|nr:CGP-CTERM sorting domain-containing protein [Thermococcus profundus]ASJ02721.1 hypothetical protein A3L09_05360 [Thermococcus profundus]